MTDTACLCQADSTGERQLAQGGRIGEMSRLEMCLNQNADPNTPAFISVSSMSSPLTDPNSQTFLLRRGF